MSKYICLCGETFKDIKRAEVHVRILTGLDLCEPYPKHKVFKQHWQARFATWACNYPWVRFMRFVGGYIIYFVLVYQFKIDWSLWEAILIGIGMGLYID